ncbi:MAG: hypothetical protein SOV37_05315, partial [Candidatus Borkfalkiaceae bacterium]|nr:hypothetical protein [Christensenellaceae bacterium]
CRIIEVKNPTEELTGHMLFTLVVGYFAYAQYDELYYLSLRGNETTAAISREGEFSQGIYFSLWSWDISLTLNMT